MLFPGHRLACQGEIVGGQLPALDQSQVSGHCGTLFQDDDIAGDELLRIQFQYLAVAHSPGAAPDHQFQSFEQSLGVKFLIEADGGIDQDNGEQDTRTAQIAQVPGQGGGDKEHCNERIPELMNEQPVERLATGFPQLIGSEPIASTSSL